MTTTQQAVARQAERKPTVTEYIGRLIPELQRAAPKGMDGDRIARLALTVVRKDRALQECDPYSFAGALLTAAALGLELGTGEAHLIAYGRECTFIPDFKGLAKLFYQHPLARHLDCQVVYANDEFDYVYGLDPFLKHKPARGDRGAIEAYYAVASLSTGARAFVVLSPEECKALRGGKVGPDKRFKGGDPMHWMERKTALKQLMKLLPKSTTLQQALDADERTGSELQREMAITAEPTTAIESGVTQTPDAGPVDTATGEVVHEGTVEDPDEPSWPDVAQPADA